MSKEKLLWGVSAGLALLSAMLAVLLVQSSAGERSVTIEPPPSVQEEEPQAVTPDAPSKGRTVAQAGSIKLGEQEFIADLRETFGDEFVRHWLLRTVVQLEAQSLGIDIDRADINEELARMQTGYESETEFYRVMREQLSMSKQDLREDALHRLMLESIATRGIEVTDSDVEQYIEDNTEQFALEREMRYAQIVVDSREHAMRVLEELQSGADFMVLAKDVSLDEATAANGGDSGWVSAGDPFIAEEVSAALASAEVGGVSEPIAISEGRWFIVTLLGRRTINPLNDSSVRTELRRELALSEAPSLFDVEAALLKKYNAVDFLEGD
jgi:foldase protein PrsA